MAHAHKARVSKMRFLLLLAFLFVVGDAFLCPTNNNNNRCWILKATPEESAKALSDYMAKSHEEKLRAVKDVEDRKNMEIKNLREEIERLKQTPVVTTTAAVTSVATTQPADSLQELQEKLISYQRFLSKYIVEAQAQKMQAVVAAEAALTKKYEEKQQLLLTGAKKEPTLYEERNAKVRAAGQAGKSRWGNMETERVSNGVTADKGLGSQGVVNGPGLAAGSNTSIVVPISKNQKLYSQRSAKVMESAKEGKSRWGDQEVQKASRFKPLAVSRNQVLYHQRNTMVSAAAKAGKSRWGKMESDRAADLAAKPLPMAVETSPEVEAADRGLRAQGSVGGPTLAERVNLGARLVS